MKTYVEVGLAFFCAAALIIYSSINELDVKGLLGDVELMVEQCQIALQGTLAEESSCMCQSQ